MTPDGATRLPRRVGALLLSTLLMLGPVSPVRAWGTDGHEAVALLADSLLLPRARERIAKVLALEPGATLPSISNWADQTRNRSIAAWHYVNLPRDADCVYLAARDCPEGKCVVGAIQRQMMRLASASSPTEQLEALKYIVHFVADIHQPLHAAFADDRGGNDYQVQALGRGMNLHSLWDTWILRDIDPSATGLANVLKSTSAPTAALAFAPERWAEESCQIVVRPDFYPSRKVGDPYLRVHEPVAGQRLQLAGFRLAALLNQIFSATDRRVLLA